MSPPVNTKQQLDKARHWFDRGYLSPADFALQSVLDLEPDDLGISIQRISDALNALEFIEVALRIQAVFSTHFEEITPSLSTHYLNTLLCLSELRKQTSGDYITLDNLSGVLNDLAHPDSDKKLRSKLNEVISLFHTGNFNQCEKEIRQCLDDYIAEFAAPVSKDIRSATTDISRQFHDPALFGLLETINAVTDETS